MLEANEAYFEQWGEPLFSSHMLDLSEEPDDENIAICVQYFKRMAPLKIFLEMEIGITGGEEDGVDNSAVDQDKLYTSPEQVWVSLSRALSCTSLVRFMMCLVLTLFTEPLFSYKTECLQGTQPHFPHVLHRCCIWQRSWSGKCCSMLPHRLCIICLIAVDISTNFTLLVLHPPSSVQTR